MRLRSDRPGFVILLAALSALPPLSIDMGLPALGLLQSSLRTTASAAALTLSLFLTGFAVSQLLVGPLSDRYGRRPVMLAGLCLYAAGGIGCALATSIGMLLGFRLLAGIGAAGGTTLALAVARDVFEGHTARVKLSTMTMASTLAPMIAPTLGGLMLALGGWRFIYGLLAVAGTLLALAAALGLAETRPAQHGARLDLLGRYTAVLRSRRTLGYAAVNGFGSAGLFSFISASPLVLMQDMGASTGLFAALFALTSGGIMVGSSTNTLLARRRVAPAVPLAVGLWLAPAAALGASAVLLAGHVSLAGFVPFVVLTGISRGLATPNGTHAALEPLPHHAGVASAVLGCTQMLGASFAAVVAAALHPLLGPLAVSLAMLAFSLGALAAWRAVERFAPAKSG